MSAVAAERTFTVLSREWCHLCHDLVAALEPVAAAYGWKIELIDVDQHPELEARWDELVPVLLHGERELCHYHLDEAAVRAYCSGFPLESRA
ncbi:Glutaredoxin [Thauera humireducens]|uniref:glutaredoxin family protein n=1 Tax=Thauera humireducens TaxID=1134435 RepID=UPI002467A352|nr:glutaredoxin family protein [Thauera humireducens]CAH1749090.1 Glutaredoxin [Thauera humireducens]